MTPAELSGRERILTNALRLFADRGVTGVSVRDIAAAADVSPANVLHHFGSKQGLVDAVDAHVVAFFERALGGSQEVEHALAGQGPDPAATLGEAFAAAIAAGSPTARYLTRLILEHDPRATELVRAWIGQTEHLLARMEADGVARSTDDAPTRAAFLVINDLAALLMRDQLTTVLGWDPLSPDGLVRWSRAAMDVYTGGVFSAGFSGNAAEGFIDTETSPQADRAPQEDA